MKNKKQQQAIENAHADQQIRNASKTQDNFEGHTPEEWHVNQYANSGLIETAGGQIIADVKPYDASGKLLKTSVWYTNKPQAQANARLIAKAYLIPALANTLESVLTSLENMNKDATLDGCMFAIREVLKKVKE